MFSRLGQMNELSAESVTDVDEAYCSNLPYFLGYNIDDILMLG